jgi:hypothetical protein
VRVFTDAELAAYETGLLARVAENTKLVCKRPLLRGTPTPGPADEALVAFTEPSGALADCSRDASALEKDGAKLRDVVASRSPAVLEIAKRCGPLLEGAITKAIAHEDACSPYSPGRRVEPPDWMTTIIAAHILGLHIQLRAEKDPVGAMWLVAESLRMYQDLGRGHPYLVPPAISAAGTSVLLDASGPLVAKLTRKQAAPFVPVFDALVATEPTYGGALRGETQYMGLMMGLANLKGPSWVPPGGTRPDLQKDNALAGTAGFDPRDEAGLLVASSELLERDVTAACPVDATYKACVDGLATMDANTKRPDTTMGDVMKSLGEKIALADTPENREKIRLELKQMVLDVMTNVARPNYKQYVAKRAVGVGKLAAMRIAVGVRQAGTCPTKAPTPATLGDTLLFERTGKTLTVKVPDWAANPDKPDSAIVRVIQCP